MWPIVAWMLAAVGLGMAAGADRVPAHWRWYAWRIYIGVVMLAALVWLVSPSYITA